MISHILQLFDTNQAVAPYVGVYNPWLVVTSVAIASIAAFTAFSISSRMAAASTWRGRWAWACAGAFSMGGGIWAMHFIGMLALSLPCGLSYDPIETSLSIIPGILASAVALWVFGRSEEPGTRQLVIGGVFMGAGIGAMHYSGMAAVETDALIRYQPSLVLVSVIVAVVLAFFALKVHYQLRVHHRSQLPARIVAASIMGLAVAGMHYTAMQASVFFPAPGTAEGGIVLPTTLLAVPLTLISSLIVGIALVGSIAGRQAELASGLQVEVARRLALEKETEDRRARLQAIFDAVVDAIITANPSGRILQWSPSAQRVFGYAPEEAIGTDLTMILSEFHTIGVTHEVTATRKGGRKFPAELTVAEVRNGDDVFLTAICRDITERKEAEAELVRAREQAEAAEDGAESGRARLQAIFDAVVDAIVTVDPGGRILQWSPGAQRIFGYAPEEVAGADLGIVLPAAGRSTEGADVATRFGAGESRLMGVAHELTATRKGGEEFPAELTITEVRDGADLFYTAILRDITERKAAEAALVRAREEAEAANLAKSQFLATMSHEIRTPMNGVLGMANLLASTVLSERQQRLVENVSRSGLALLGIINDILDFAKIEAGMFELSSMPFDPRQAVAELTDLFSDRCSKKGIEFIYFVDESIPSQIIGDPIRLRQILVNLVGNAIKFTERGEILVEVGLASSDDSEMVLNIAVEDTGIGIPPEHSSRIFDSFHQVDGSMSRARGGSGLGLSITRQLVELMGGKISVDSELGRGSRFSLTARFKHADGAIKLSRLLPRPLCILLVDANAVSAHVMSLYLANWQVKATIVSTIEEAEAEQAAAIAAGRPFDVAVLDIKGLGAPAVEFGKAILAEPSRPQTEIVLLVGLDGYMADTSLDSLGAIAVLPKPAHPSELFAALAESAVEPGQRDLTPSFKRRNPQAKRPSFGARILVAEDNGVNEEVITGLLESMDCRVVTAPHGRAAVKLFAQEAFDLILMDCEMPVMDGLEATRRIRQIEAMSEALPDGSGARRKTPIVALTAHALNDVRERCLGVGMDDFLVKPFDDQQMATTLLRWLVPRGEATKEKPELVAPLPPDTAVQRASEPPIDLGVIDGLRALDRNGKSSRLARAVSRFVEVAPPLVAAIHKNHDDNDAEALWRAAHSLKSSAGALGARQLSQRCAEIETIARNSGTAGLQSLVAALDGDLSAAIDALQALAGEMHAAA
ncbi:MAG TPA: PAS domain S-box protein [Stellaceae bacterium]|nr:PAS domain S-box protein [Stellaceae bacterium]